MSEWDRIDRWKRAMERPTSKCGFIWSDTIFKTEYVDVLSLHCPKRPTKRHLAWYAMIFLYYYVGDDSHDRCIYGYYPWVLIGLWSGMSIKNLYYLSPNIFYESDQRFRKPLFNIDAACHSMEKMSSSILTNRQTNWLKILVTKLNIVVPGKEFVNEKEFQLAINYVGFLAMILMRILVHDDDTVKAFIRNHATEYFEKFWGKQVDFGPCDEPHDKLISALHDGRLQRHSRASNNLLTYLVQCRITSTLDNSIREPYIRTILDAACLQTLQFTGMACYTWLLKAAVCTKILPKDLLKHFQWPCLKRQVKYVENFLDKYPGNTDERSWPWARLLDDDALIDLSNTDTPSISVICAAIVHGSDLNHQIWQEDQQLICAQKSEFFSRDLGYAKDIRERILQE